MKKVGIYFSPRLRLSKSEKKSNISDIKNKAHRYFNQDKSTKYFELKSIKEMFDFCHSSEYGHMYVFADNYGFSDTNEWQEIINSLVNDEQEFTISFLKLNK